MARLTMNHQRRTANVSDNMSINDKTTALQAVARRLLEADEVQTVLGYARGTEGYRSRTLFVTSPEGCEQLIWDATCTPNLANYLRKRPGRTAVVVKGCDARAVAVLISEHQLSRDDLYLIGVPCEGMIDWGKLQKQAGVKLSEVKSLQIEGDEAVIGLETGEKRVAAIEVRRDECLGCLCPTPPIYDELVGDEIAPRDQAAYLALMKQLEGLSPAERAAYFERQFERCIRCFACVQACPMCYCTTCFAIQEKPQYVPRTVGLDENRMFHLGRAMHLAGRCVSCGACDRACPVDIPLRALNTKLALETKELFGTVAGLDMEVKPPLIEFLPGDTEEALDTGQ